MCTLVELFLIRNMAKVDVTSLVGFLIHMDGGNFVSGVLGGS